jgi:hypothetical protein
MCTPSFVCCYYAKPGRHTKTWGHRLGDKFLIAPSAICVGDAQRRTRHCLLITISHAPIQATTTPEISCPGSRCNMCLYTKYVPTHILSVLYFGPCEWTDRTFSCRKMVTLINTQRGRETCRKFIYTVPVLCRLLQKAPLWPAASTSVC